ncbi:hypothetical protein ONZ45_g19472 [Pleurotus djamor]|nr:hypothetical protein ONZ45_g19472 [Pleurotus djamor]
MWRALMEAERQDEVEAERREAERKAEVERRKAEEEEKRKKEEEEKRKKEEEERRRKEEEQRREDERRKKEEEALAERRKLEAQIAALKARRAKTAGQAPTISSSVASTATTPAVPTASVPAPPVASNPPAASTASNTMAPPPVPSRRIRRTPSVEVVIPLPRVSAPAPGMTFKGDNRCSLCLAADIPCVIGDKLSRKVTSTPCQACQKAGKGCNLKTKHNWGDGAESKKASKGVGKRARGSVSSVGSPQQKKKAKKSKAVLDSEDDESDGVQIVGGSKGKGRAADEEDVEMEDESSGRRSTQPSSPNFVAGVKLPVTEIRLLPKQPPRETYVVKTQLAVVLDPKIWINP